MLTPKFEISQDALHLFIKIHINNIRFNTGNLDITINKNLFNFTLLPYYLRLKFNDDELLMSEEDIVRGNMIQDLTLNNDEEIQKQAPEQPFACRLITDEDGNECVIIKLYKLEKNFVFQDLDNHLKLLSRDNEDIYSNGKDSLLNVVNKDQKSQQKPLIQELDDNVNDIEMISKLGGAFDWQIKQTLHSSENENLDKKIGFSLKHSASAVIASIYNNNEINEVSESLILKKEDQKDFEKELIQLRNYRDNLKFDGDYYMNDYITYKYGPTTEMMREDLEINGILKILKYIPKDIKHFLQWVKLKQIGKPKFKDILQYTSFEQEQMREKLPKTSKHEFGSFAPAVVPSSSPLFVPLQRSPRNLTFAKLDEKWQRNFVFIINVLFGYFFQEMEFDFDLEDTKSTNPGTSKPASREQTSERTWLIGKLAPQLSNLDQVLLLKAGSLKESCNWSPSHDATDEDVDLESDSGEFIIKQVDAKDEIEQCFKKDEIFISSEDELIKASLIISTKKSLSYPLHRNIQLSLKVIDYVNYSLIAGSKFIIKILLKIHELFRYDEVYYIYNKIWFDDFITWLLQFSNTSFHDLNDSVVKGDEILDNIFRDMATQVSTISKGFKKEDFDFMIIQNDLNKEGNNIEWDSLNIAEIENIGDVKFKELALDN